MTYSLSLFCRGRTSRLHCLCCAISCFTTAFFFSSSGLSASSFSQALRAFRAQDRMKSHLSISLISTSTCGRSSAVLAMLSCIATSACLAAGAAVGSSASESLLSPASAAATACMPASSQSESLLSGSVSGCAALRPPSRSSSPSCGSSASESSLSSSSSPPFSPPSAASSSSSSPPPSACSLISICCCCVWCRLSSMTTSGFFLPSCASFSSWRSRLYLCMSVSPNRVMGSPISRSRSMTSPMLSGGSASSSPRRASS
mmetsp:Transcript_106452/g.328830  ORF Transcript_106452/g.328830 Transcript_106452/m.328830 type:complete len:259 (-) Transcript_106452:361-1137(-)